MFSSLTGRSVARRIALGFGASSAVGGVAVTAYAYSHQGLGFRREIYFWSVVSPVVLDYWWNASSSSPYTKYKELRQQNTDDPSENENLSTGKLDGDIEKPEKRKSKHHALHERNAPRIFSVLLELGGLYIKLGQVLSVAALPIPEQYRTLFRTLQSNVPGHEEYESVIRPTLEKEFGCPLLEIFESVDEIPCGAASIGQAHKATLRDTQEEVIIKVQYPSAKWQVPADIQCVGDFMRMSVYFGLVDETSAKLSFEEFSRQFLSELDYGLERKNLEEVYASSLDPKAPYIRRRVVIPKVYPEFCTNQVITMSYLPGPKFEEEAKQQLELLGFNTKREIRDVVRETADHAKQSTMSIDIESSQPEARNISKSKVWQKNVSQFVSTWIGIESIFSALRIARKILLWSRVATVSSIRILSTLALIPEDWETWAKEHENAALQAARLDWTHDAVYSLLDVHGYQILNQGLFNADPHPGNLLIVQGEKGQPSEFAEPKIGLIDYGQCKRLTAEERVRVARLILSVADEAPDSDIASCFRDLGIQTKNDSTEFLAKFARLMFGSFKPEHLNHSWHKALHEEDKVLYFPSELTMVYRTSLLLRGLAMSLQLNVSVGEQWRHHAQSAIESNPEIKRM